MNSFQFSCSLEVCHNFQPSAIVGDSNARTIFQIFEKRFVVFPSDIVQHKDGSFRKMVHGVFEICIEVPHADIIHPVRGLHLHAGRHWKISSMRFRKSRNR